MRRCGDVASGLALAALAVQLRRWPTASPWACWSACPSCCCCSARRTSKLAGCVGERLRRRAVPGSGLLDEPIGGRAPARPARRAAGRLRENARLREENRRLLGLAGRGGPPRASRTRPCARCCKVPAVERRRCWTTARVVADSGGPFVQTLLIDAGAEQGIATAWRRSTREGLVGRVVEVGRRSARVLLMTDFNSRVPVMVERSGDQAILEGDNRPAARAALPAARARLRGRRPRADLGRRRRAAARPGDRPDRVDGGRQGDGPPYVDWARLDYARRCCDGRPAAAARPRPCRSARRGARADEPASRRAPGLDCAAGRR